MYKFDHNTTYILHISTIYFFRLFVFIPSQAPYSFHIRISSHIYVHPSYTTSKLWVTMNFSHPSTVNDEAVTSSKTRLLETQGRGRFSRATENDLIIQANFKTRSEGYGDEYSYPLLALTS